MDEELDEAAAQVSQTAAQAELLERAQDAVAMAQAAGAEGVWASASRSREVEYNGRDGKIESVKEATARSLSLKLYVDGRYSSHRTTSLKPDRLKKFVTEAVALTRALQPDPQRQLPDPALFEGRPTVDLDLVDPRVATMDGERRKQALTILDEGAHAHDAVISATGYVGTTESHGGAASSNGFEGSWSGTEVWLGSETTVKDEGDRRPEGGYWVGARQFPDLLPPDVIAAEALRRATSRLGTVKGPTRKTTLVVDPTVGGRLIGRLLGSANARSVQQGRSFWTGKVGEKLFSDKLTLVDDPLIPRGLGSRHFDGEGIAAKKLTLIEEGVVRNLFVDTYYGRKADMTPTSGGSSNLVVQPGVDKGLEELIADVGSGIYLTSWLGGNADGTTGDFSFGLRGHLIEKGGIGAPVGEMNVTGNLVDLFGKLVMVGNDPWPFRSSRVPTLVFEGVDFSGA